MGKKFATIAPPSPLEIGIEKMKAEIKSHIDYSESEIKKLKKEITNPNIDAKSIVNVFIPAHEKKIREWRALETFLKEKEIIK